MKNPLLAAALAVPLAAAAADPSDPDVPVPPPAYRSAFAGLPTGVEQESLDWRKANGSVAEFPRGHIDLLKWEQAQGRARGAPADSAPADPRALPGDRRPESRGSAP